MDKYTREKTDKFIEELVACIELDYEQNKDYKIEVIKKIENDDKGFFTDFKEVIRAMSEESFEKIYKDSASIDILRKVIEKMTNEEQAEIVNKYTFPFLNETLQKENSQLLPEIIEKVKIDSFKTIEIWNNINSEVQLEFLPRVIEQLKQRGYAISEIWKNKNVEEQSNLLLEVIGRVNDSSYAISEIWKNTNAKVQSDFLIKTIQQLKENNLAIIGIWTNTNEKVQLNLLSEMLNQVKDDSDKIMGIWNSTNTKVQETKSYLLPKIIDEVEGNIYAISEIWKNTNAKTQKANSHLLPKIMEEVKGDRYAISEIWKNTNAKVQLKSLPKIIELEQFKENNDALIKIWKDTNAEIIYQIFETLTSEQKKANIEFAIKALADDSIFCRDIQKLLQPIHKGINVNKLTEILTMRDNEYLNKYVINDIIVKNMNDNNINIKDINQQIDKIHNIFLTNNLPEVFKIYEFFKHHPNHENTNHNLYKDMSYENRDKIILQDLFTTALNSGNKQLRDFFELLQNGDIIYNKNKNGYEINEIEESLLFTYNNSILSLYRMLTEADLDKINTEKIIAKLQLDKNSNIGDKLLTKLLEIKDGSDNIIEINSKELIKYIDNKRDEINKRNEKNANELNIENILENGDLVKGFDIKYLNSHMRLGIRAKEFNMEGALSSDFTPLDTDFSQISENNMKNRNLQKIINSTESSNYGATYYVVKKGDFDEEKSWQDEKTRYIRTAIGSNNISYILTKEWDEKYSYTMAQNGIYIPVVDLESEKIIFSPEQYKNIRSKMKGLTFYGMDDFEIDENTQNSKILENAEELKKQVRGQMSISEKREKIVRKIEQELPKNISLVQQISGDLSSQVIELIDTGSTGRGTCIPGDEDFDFMLKGTNEEINTNIISKIKQAISSGKDKGGTDEYNVRYKDVKIDEIEDLVDIDVTSEIKRLDLEYSSDMCIRDRLDNIRKNYSEEMCQKVVDNIIVAKKKLKEAGVYKKSNSTGATSKGGFGGIGIENWILQNGGSFILAMETFLDNSKDESGEEIEFEMFKKKYPIYDFGQNHKSQKNYDIHDHFIEGLTLEGFNEMKNRFPKILQEYGITYKFDKNEHQINPIPYNNQDEKRQFGKDIIEFAMSAPNITISDYTRIYKFMAVYESRKNQKYNEFEEETIR